jgi:holo-[acyl-carrier protein] synthase
MIRGHGVDLVSIDRIRKILEREDNHFEGRVFSAGEIAYCRSKKDPHPHFAARFAAKEAYGKALGMGRSKWPTMPRARRS